MERKSSNIRISLSSDHIRKLVENVPICRTESEISEEDQNVQEGNLASSLPSRRMSLPARQQHGRLERQYSEASSPPPAVMKGLRINVVPLDKKSWLEVRDPKHRYGKRLRLFYKEWSHIGKPGNSFFKWLEDTNCDVPGCTREELDRDTVCYLTTDVERQPYQIKIVDGSKVVNSNSSEPIATCDQGWIFVLRDGQLLAAEKQTSPPRFHHSSFFGGECVEAAGMLVCDVNGKLTRIFPHSGHYRPCDGHLYTLLRHLRKAGLDLSKISVDGQRTFHVARSESDDGGKVPKLQSPLMVNGQHMFNFLAHKRKAWASQVFHDLRRAVQSRSTLNNIHSSSSSAHGDDEFENEEDEKHDEQRNVNEGWGWGDGFLCRLLRLHNFTV